MKKLFCLRTGLVGLATLVFSFVNIYGANLALNRTVTTSSNYNSSYTGAKAVDGVISSASKWTSNGASATSWMYVDLGSNKAITHVVVKHAGSSGEPTTYNTSNFTIQTWDGANWVTRATVTNNTASVTVHNFTATTSRVRLYITDAGIDNYARIPELQVNNGPLTCAVTLSSTGTSRIGWIYQNSSFTSRTCGSVGAGCGSNGWNVTCSSNCGLHKGDDYYADDWIRYDGSWNNISCGENVYAPFAGTVMYANRLSYSYGRTVIIRSSANNTFAFRVAHLQGFAPNIYAGATVSQGQLIGFVGNDDGTGNGETTTFVCHAHAVLYKNITTGNGVTNLNGGHAPSGSIGGSQPASSYAASYYLDAVGCTSNKIGDDDLLSAEEAPIPSSEGNLYGLEVFPHPVSGSATIRWQQFESAEVQIRVINMMGQPVRDLSAYGTFGGGSQEIPLEASALKSGMYFLVVKDNNSTLTKKITVVHN